MPPKTQNPRYIFIGMAWPYANGSLHLGHIAGLLPADILARYHRLRGDNALFVSGSDCHGTPIAVKARETGKTPQEISDFYHREFIDNFKKLGFSFDYYGKTSALGHKKIVQKIFLELYQKGYIYKEKQLLTYCPKCKQFLPDRYIEGTCPKCGYEKARGDQCDKCGALLDPKELINPHCKFCGTTPIEKKSEHFFLKLTAFEKKLKAWVKKQKTWRPNALNFTKKFLEQGLKDRAVTRDIDWGVTIPLEGYSEKKIYVWFEAVCGYFTDCINWSQQIKKENAWKKWWKNEKSWHYYVHGKDNIPFHTVIWPSILMGLEKHLPNQIISSEYLTIENKKLSTSENWAVWIPDYLTKYDPDVLRYYLVANGPETHDANFSWDKFVVRNNSELVGVYGNLVNRFLKFSVKNFTGQIKKHKIDPQIENKIKNTFTTAAKLIEQTHFRNALKEIFTLAHFGNRYIDQKEPWRVIKKNKDKCEEILFNVLQIIYALSILLYPFLPRSSEKLFKLFSIRKEKLKWGYKPLILKIKLKLIGILFEKLDEAIAEKEKNKLG